MLEGPAGYVGKQWQIDKADIIIGRSMTSQIFIDDRAFRHVDWKDTSKPLALRVRSYVDINCAHCHREGSHCSYRSMRFAFSESGTSANMGVCITPDEDLGNGLTKIVFPGKPQRSVMDFRINSTNGATMMPLLGRTIVHEEAAEMINQWITSLETCD